MQYTARMTRESVAHWLILRDSMMPSFWDAGMEGTKGPERSCAKDEGRAEDTLSPRRPSTGGAFLHVQHCQVSASSSAFRPIRSRAATLSSSYRTLLRELPVGQRGTLAKGS